MKIARHLVPETQTALDKALNRAAPYTPSCAWPEDCTVQWGNGIIPANPFFEAFPAGGGFIRGDGETLEAAERAAFAKWEREAVCRPHFWSRWHPTRGTYLNTGAHCRKCGCFHSGVFREVVLIGKHRRPLRRWEKDHLISMETDHEMNAHMDRVYPERSADRRKSARLLRLRMNLFGVDEGSSRFGLFDSTEIVKPPRRASPKAGTADRPTSPLEAPIDGELREAAISAVGEAVDYLDWGGAERAVDAILSLLQSRQANGAGSAEGWKLVPVEPTEAMLKAAFVAMNETPSGTWKRMKEEGVTPRRLFDVKMAPRYRAMLAAAPAHGNGETER